VPFFRSELAQIRPYEAGRPIEDVARELGADPRSLAKLASNESPFPPFPEVSEAIARAGSGVNRYPDNGLYDLSHAVAASMGVQPDQLWFGGGTSELLRVACHATGGSATSTLYAWPSFVVYRLASILAGSRQIEVPLAAGHIHDLEAMAAAINADSTLIFVCNPNNPTGTHLPAARVEEFISQVPGRILVVVDEAYAEYATADDYATAIPLALERPNVIVTRTFSKVYGLAALRVGYAVGQTATLRELRKAQAPFSVGSLAQVAAVEALRHPDRVAERTRLNAEGRHLVSDEMKSREVEHAPSQANFVYFRIGQETAATLRSFLAFGLILRGFENGWTRVTIGSEEENRRFIKALDQLL
jgi:histidinol-phosphate aminotransferase